MPRIALLVAVIALCVALAVPANCNLFLEPGVEGGTQTLSGTPPAPLSVSMMSGDTPWDTNWNGFEYTVFTVASTGAHSGSKCIQGYDYGGAAPIGLRQFVALEPDTQYSLSFWYKTTGAGWTSGNICEAQLWINGGWNKVLGNIGGTGGAWAQKTYSFSTPADATSGGIYLNVYQGAGAAGDNIYFDDFNVFKTGTPGRFFNGDFETGDTTAWTGFFYMNTQFGVTTTDPHGGTYCAVGTGLVNGGENGSNVPFWCSPIEVIPNHVYNISYATRNAGSYWDGNDPIPGDRFTSDQVWVEWHDYTVPFTSSPTFDGSGGVIAQNTLVEHIVNSRPSWVESGNKTVIASETAQSAILGFRCHISPNETFFMDDVAIQDLGEAGTLLNSGFELGNLLGWSTSDPCPCGIGITAGVTTDAPHGGSYAAEITGVNGNCLSHIGQTVACQPLHRYTASMWYKTAGVWSGNALDGAIEERKGDNSYAGYSHHTPLYATLLPEWGRMTINFVTGPETTRLYWDVGMNLYNNDKVFLDDFELIDNGVAVTYTNIGEARKAGSSNLIECDAVVTKVVEIDAIWPRVYFVEQEDRSAGMLVECADELQMYPTPLPGTKVHIKGVVENATTAGFSGTLAIHPTELVENTGTLTPEIKPVGTILRPLVDGTGAPLDGLLVRAGGMVTSSDDIAGVFFVNDGSTGTSVAVRTSYQWPFPQVGEMWVVNGNVATLDGARFIYVNPFDTLQKIEPEVAAQ